MNIYSYVLVIIIVESHSFIEYYNENGALILIIADQLFNTSQAAINNK